MEVMKMCKECCEENCKSGCGCENSCSCESCGEESVSHSKMMMDLANDAWEELMMEKMKSSYEKAVGDKMNKAAQVCVEACIAYWGQKMKGEASWAEFEEKLRKSMM